jgi:Na+-driven multidrug efflux pump
LRELVIQIGIALTGLVGFAFGKFKWSTLSKIFTAIFVIGWVFWLAVGFPQIFSDKLFLPALLPVHLSQSMVYLLNRVLKFALFLVFFFAVDQTASG